MPLVRFHCNFTERNPRWSNKHKCAHFMETDHYRDFYSLGSFLNTAIRRHSKNKSNRLLMSRSSCQLPPFFIRRCWVQNRVRNSACNGADQLYVNVKLILNCRGNYIFGSFLLQRILTHNFKTSKQFPSPRFVKGGRSSAGNLPLWTILVHHQQLQTRM